MRLADAHCHLTAGQEPMYRALLASGQYRVAFSISDVSEQAFCSVQALCNEYPGQVVYSAGIHPWRAGLVTLEEMEPAMESAAMVGEIGLDEGWGNRPLACQLEAFHAQLAWAERAGKGVVLHLHNLEAEGLAALQQYQLPRVLVHWYAGDPQILEMLIARECWFTVGPDFAANQGVHQVIQRVPLDRLLVETDGMEALRWVIPNALPTPQQVLQNAISAIAKVKNVPVEQAEKATWENFERVYKL